MSLVESTTFKLRHIVFTPGLDEYSTFVYNDGGTRYYHDYPILTDGAYGGLEWHYSSGGKQAPFSVVLPVFTDSADDVDSNFTFRTLVDTSARQYTTNNGWTIRGGDEIELWVQKPGDVEAGRIYNGIVMEVEPIVGEDQDRVLRISGVSYADYWLYSRVFQRDYRTTGGPRASDIIVDIFKAAGVFFDYYNLDVNGLAQDPTEIIHSVIGADPHPPYARDTATSVQHDSGIYKEFQAVSCAKAMQEVCALVNTEWYIDANKKLTLAVVGLAQPISAVPITENLVIGKPSIKWSDDGYHYDSVFCSAASNMTAPNSTSPTGDAWCSDVKYWNLREFPNGLGSIGEIDQTNSFIVSGQMVGGAHTSVTLGWYALAGRATTAAACITAGPPQENAFSGWVKWLGGGGWNRGNWQGLNLLEADFDEFNFGFQNYFNLNSFYVRLCDGDNGVNGYWMSGDLLLRPQWDPSKGKLMKWQVKLPTYTANHASEIDTFFWGTYTGAEGQQPTKIDEIQFLFIAQNTADDLAYDVARDTADTTKILPTMITYTHFSKTPAYEKITEDSNKRPTPRQMIVIDKTITDQTIAQQLAEQELVRVRESSLTGTITVDDDYMYLGPKYVGSPNLMRCRPGDSVVLDIPYYGLDYTRRIDHIANSVEDNFWVSTIGFGTFNTDDVFSIYHNREDVMKAASKGASTPAGHGGHGGNKNWSPPKPSAPMTAWPSNHGGHGGKDSGWSPPPPNSGNTGSTPKPMKKRGIR